MIPTPPFTGATDIDGNPIKIGDYVWVYPQQYEEVSRDTSGEIDVVEVDSSRPKPVLDVPLYAGTVQWSDYDLRFEVRIERDFGKHGIVSVGLGGGNYAFQIGNNG